MKLFKSTIFLFLLILISSPAFTATSYLHCKTLLDVKSGELLKDRLIQIENSRIINVSHSSVDSSDNSKDIISVSGTCLPGLMDMHVHLDGQLSKNGYIKRFQSNEADYALRAAKHAKITLMAGFTTVRNPGDNYNSTIALRKAINRGDLAGPRIFTSGKSLATTGGHADPSNGSRTDLMGDPGPMEGVINSPDDARKAVRQRYKDGADFIKITATGGVLSLAKNGQNPQFNAAELEAVVATANDYGMHVAAHAHGKEGMRRAIIAGVRSIEHGTYMDDEIFQLMKQHKTWYVPTIIAGNFVAEKAREADYFPAVVRPKAATIGPIIKATFANAWKAGVAIAFGTDSGVSPHGENATEFVYMVEAGMPAIEAIRSATINSALLLGMEEEIGSIEAGKLADIIVVAGNPLKDIKQLQNIKLVMKAGRIFKHNP